MRRFGPLFVLEVQRSPRPPAPRLRAFTLVELLVVMAMIALLASLLLPALQNAKERARRAQCLSALRQYGIYLNIYVEDWDKYPPARWLMNERITTSTDDPIVLHFAPRLPGPDLPEIPEIDWPKWKLRCPERFASAYNYNTFTWTLDDAGAQPPGLDLSGYPTKELPGVIPVPQSSAANPSGLIAYTERVWWRMLPLETNNFFADFPRARSSYPLPLEGRERWAPALWPHKTGLDQLFCDGHVEFVGAARFAADPDELRQRWFLDNLPHRELARVTVSLP